MTLGVFWLSGSDPHTVVLGVYACIAFWLLSRTVRMLFACRQAFGRFLWPDAATQLRRIVVVLIASLVASLSMHALPPAVLPERS